MYPRPLVPEDLHRDGQAKRRSLLRAIAVIAVGRARKEEPQPLCETFYPSDENAMLIVRASTHPTSTTVFPKTIGTALTRTPVGFLNKSRKKERKKPREAKTKGNWFAWVDPEVLDMLIRLRWLGERDADDRCKIMVVGPPDF